MGGVRGAQPGEGCGGCAEVSNDPLNLIWALHIRDSVFYFCVSPVTPSAPRSLSGSYSTQVL